MRHVLGIFAALIALGVGIAVVKTTEIAIAAIFPLDDISVRSEQEYSLDHYALENALTEHINFNIRGVHVGSTEKEMLRVFGRPQKAEHYSGDVDQAATSTYYYSGLTVEVIEYEDGKRKVISFSIDTNKWNVEGITVGSSVDDVERVFGRPRFRTDEDMFYSDISDLDVDFVFEKGRIVRIYLLYDNC
jgi:hypothetical protein